MKRLLLLFAIFLIALPVMAQDDMDPCVLDPPESPATEVNFIGVAHSASLSSWVMSWRSATKSIT